MAKATEGNMLSCQSDGSNTERHRWVSILDNAEMTNPGYTILPSGLTIQFGAFYAQGQHESHAEQIVNFKKPFKTKCLTAQSTVQWDYSESHAPDWYWVKSCDKNKVVWSHSVPGRQWMAIGY